MQIVKYNCIYKKKYTAYFDNAVMLFGIFYAIKESQLDYIGLQIITYPILLLSVGFSLLSVFHNCKLTLLNTLFFFVLFCVPVYLKIAYNSNVLIRSILILAAYNIPFSHTVKMCMKTIIMVFSIVLLSLCLGVVEDRLYYKDVDMFQDGYAHDLGFKYFSYSYLVMGFVQCCIYLWQKNMNIIKIVFLITLSYIIFIVSSTRLQLYACTAFILAIFFLPYIPKKIINNKILAFIAVIAYPLICLIQYFVSKYHILSLFYDGYAELNKTMSGRLRLNEEAFMRYDVTLWGNDLEFNNTPGANYFYIDSGYLHVLLGDGLFFTMVILILYAILTYKIYKARAYYLYVWILIYSILNISNGFLVNILANPILLLAFSDTETIHMDYILCSKKKKTKIGQTI